MSEEKIVPFQMISPLLWKLNISDNAKIVYCVIANYARMKNNTEEMFVAWPSYQTIAEDCNQSVSSVRRSVGELRSAELIGYRHGKNNGNEYGIRWITEEDVKRLRNMERRKRSTSGQIKSKPVCSAVSSPANGCKSMSDESTPCSAVSSPVCSAVSSPVCSALSKEVNDLSKCNEVKYLAMNIIEEANTSDTRDAKPTSGSTSLVSSESSEPNVIESMRAKGYVPNREEDPYFFVSKKNGITYLWNEREQVFTESTRGTKIKLMDIEHIT